MFGFRFTSSGCLGMLQIDLNVFLPSDESFLRALMGGLNAGLGLDMLFGLFRLDSSGLSFISWLRLGLQVFF